MKKLNYAILEPGGQITFKEGKGDTLDILHKEIKNYVDVVRLPNNLDLWVDDEGLLKELKPTIVIKNSRTSKLTNRDILLVGPVVFASHDGEGNTISLSLDSIALMADFVPAMCGPYKVLIYPNFK